MDSKNEEIALRLEHVSKFFPGVKALDDICFEAKKGEVHAIVGENGAGKSTLIKCISGAHSPDEGNIFINGKLFKSIGPHDSIANGIATVYQELSLIPTLSASENIFLGVKREGDKLFNDKKNNEECIKIFEKLGIKGINPKSIISELSGAQKQLVEIARAVSRDVKVLILDEPTSSLTVNETEFLMDMIRKLKRNGVTIIYISHIFDETFAISDRITVMRDGKYIDTLNTEETSREELIRLMVGREIGMDYPKRKNQIGETVLRVEELSGPGVDSISFELRKGEILGFAGLVGAGRTELMNLIFCAAKKTGGKIYLNGKELKMKTPLDAIRNGLGIIPEERKVQGLLLYQDIQDNISVANLSNLCKFGIYNERKAGKLANKYREQMRIKTPSLHQIVNHLSGGNQQKVAVAKAVAPNPSILIFDEPTRGVDVGAKQEIYTLMNELVENGASILMVSSEMGELIGMSDRIIVLQEHHMAGELLPEEFSQEHILNLASGE